MFSFGVRRMLDGARKGRGATGNPAVRFERLSVEPADDGWGSLDELAGDPAPRTEIYRAASRSAISRNQSPDIPFDRSINPFMGCEHGCIYCYARPSHAWWGWSPGLDFESRIVVKPDLPRHLRAELAQPGYQPQVIALGTNTDPYQPVEGRLRITRQVLEVLAGARHPVGIVTKSARVVRDLDLLRDLARDRLVHVDVSITTLDPTMARTLEPRASAPAKRLDAVATLAAAGVPVGVNISPIIPGLNDHEIERIAEAAAGAGAVGIGSILVRLPLEVAPLMEAWLRAHVPDRAERVLSLIRQTRGGRINNSCFGQRMRGEGPVAELIQRRVQLARRRHGLEGRTYPSRTDLFRRPGSERQPRLL